MATMTGEDHAQKYSNSDCGGSGIGRPCKRPKQKKVPQRGLGVAQLEKIRLEEQQKKDADLPPPNPNFINPDQPSSQIHLSPSFSLQNIDAKVSGTVPLANGVGFDVGWPSVPVQEHKNMPEFCNSYEFDFEESYGVDPRLPSQSAICLPCDSNRNLPLQNWAPRAQQYQQPSSIVNVSSGTSSMPAVQCSMEPPSNQNYGGSYIPMKPEEQMIDMKRPYPFSVDVPPAPNFNFKLPAFAVPVRTNEAISHASGSGFNSDACNPTLSNGRGAPSSSASYPEPNREKSNNVNEDYNGDFLTLALRTANSCIATKSKSPPSFIAFQNQAYPGFESLSSLEIIGHQFPHPSGFSHRFSQKPPLYNFFPAKAEVGQITAENETFNGEFGEGVDLNLKL